MGQEVQVEKGCTNDTLFNPVQNGHFYRKYRGFEGPPVDSDCVVDEEIIRERLLYLHYAFRTIRS